MIESIQIPAYLCCGVFGWAVPWQKWLERAPVAVRVINHTMPNNELRSYMHTHQYVYVYSRIGQLDTASIIGTSLPTRGKEGPLITSFDLDKYLLMGILNGERSLAVDWAMLEADIINTVMNRGQVMYTPTPLGSGWDLTRVRVTREVAQPKQDEPKQDTPVASPRKPQRKKSP